VVAQVPSCDGGRGVLEAVAQQRIVAQAAALAHDQLVAEVIVGVTIVAAVFGAQQAIAGVDRIAGLAAGDHFNAVAVGVVTVVGCLPDDAGQGVGAVELGGRGGAASGQGGLEVSAGVVTVLLD